ncbi:MAG: ATP-binding protein [Pseudomonadota bacterium]
MTLSLPREPGIPWFPQEAPKHVEQLDSALDAVGPAVEAVCSAICRRSDGSEQAAVDDLRIALTEGITNVIEHAYASERGHPVSVALWFDGGAATVCILDEGGPLPQSIIEVLRETVVDLQEPGDDPVSGDGVLLGPDLAVAIDELPEGGWGWMLIRQSVDRIHYRRADNRNHLFLQKRLVAIP